MASNSSSLRCPRSRRSASRSSWRDDVARGLTGGSGSVAHRQRASLADPVDLGLEVLGVRDVGQAALALGARRLEQHVAVPEQPLDHRLREQHVVDALERDLGPAARDHPAPDDDPFGREHVVGEPVGRAPRGPRSPATAATATARTTHRTGGVERQRSRPRRRRAAASPRRGRAAARASAGGTGGRSPRRRSAAAPGSARRPPRAWLARSPAREPSVAAGDEWPSVRARSGPPTPLPGPRAGAARSAVTSRGARHDRDTAEPGPPTRIVVGDRRLRARPARPAVGTRRSPGARRDARGRARLPAAEVAVLPAIAALPARRGARGGGLRRHRRPARGGGGLRRRPGHPHVAQSGGAAGVLCSQADDADLVVVGSRGRGGFKGLLLGSVSQQVATHAPCPVVIVGHEDG